MNFLQLASFVCIYDSTYYEEEKYHSVTLFFLYLWKELVNAWIFTKGLQRVEKKRLGSLFRPWILIMPRGKLLEYVLCLGKYT